jgi:hypothetical protein
VLVRGLAHWLSPVWESSYNLGIALGVPTYRLF